MVDKPFKTSLWTWIGECVDRAMGLSHTTVTEKDSRSRVVTLRYDNQSGRVAVIRCVRVTYKTQYRKWWMPYLIRTLFCVSADVDDSLKALHDKGTFDPVYYPMLCNRLLRWTTYPHQRAIQAYLDHLAGKLSTSLTVLRR